ncbi:ABC transporter substrate-binding protein [Phyllobacterium sp. 21LDTY02-6]|uniref:ABC transporter substrate-binding protein n=1 Tax=unclassified Phyllobacterium TaxID=2638441 RepID=UPI00208ED11E|nr:MULTISPECIES: ABC transporter substrate-binding protein [unclassified Phyllobacterium]MCO4318195.1 ABC transporter substrate-binding protein [Phyllobacterium sp. 21LDTY02-6]MCX8280190.1 ABC transporter substrate-binding protein [Phyllobacterium sp. 0TCS1.6C]MCX8294249.1 ABC transporter substrate-binding protein [Phyllobacterium sp. 0TCS1.6A]
MFVNASQPLAQEANNNAAAKPVKEIRIGYLRAYEPQLALSVLDIPPRDEGVAGADVAIKDNNTTGKFLGQQFLLETRETKFDEDVVPAFKEMVAKGSRLILTDISAKQLLSVADLAKESGVLLFNVGATDDALREEECRSNIFHTAPTRSMLADGLAQYLVWKQWRKWVLLYGSHERDKLYAEAIRRAAARFGATIVEEREYEDRGTARRTDSGVVLVQQQMPVFTQNLPEHEVVIVADESEVFGSYVPYRTWTPRPVAGTSGLVASSWHPASEQWGGVQIQNRFAKTTGRRMLSKDMQAWTAVRIIGEAATRSQSAEPKDMETYIKSDQFSIAAFKGQKLSFRNWNWQLRQPILVGDGHSVVSTSPQAGFLHQTSELDTLGVDRPESKCQLN